MQILRFKDQAKTEMAFRSMGGSVVVSPSPSSFDRGATV